MKKVLLLILIVAGFYACNNNSDKTATPDLVPEKQMKFSAGLTQEKITGIGAGEYAFLYVTPENSYMLNYAGNVPHISPFGIIATKPTGGQYWCAALVNNVPTIFGRNGSEQLYTVTLGTDTTGAPFTCDTVMITYQSLTAIKNGDVWYCSYGTQENAQDVFHQQSGAGFTKWTKICSGKNIVRITGGAVTSFASATLWMLGSDGKVWELNRTTTTPQQVHFPGDVATDFALLNGDQDKVIITANDMYSWSGSNFRQSLATGDRGSLSVVSIKSYWQNAGFVFPARQVVGGYSTLAMLDQNYHVFTSGITSNGELGNGTWYNPMRTRPGTPWQWNLNTNGNGTGYANGIDTVSAPKMILGCQMSYLISSNTVTFYKYAFDMGGLLYSWGRDKGGALGNGGTFTSNNQAAYPNNRDIPAPRKVNPIYVSWSYITPNLTSTQPPVMNAGVDQYITRDSAVLYANGSANQESTIKEIIWSQVSGAATTISNINSYNPVIRGLTNGKYVYNVHGTNMLNLTGDAQVTINVSGIVVTPPPPPPPPVVTIDSLVGSYQLNHTVPLFWRSNSSLPFEVQKLTNSIWKKIGTATLKQFIDTNIQCGANVYRIKSGLIYSNTLTVQK